MLPMLHNRSHSLVGFFQMSGFHQSPDIREFTPVFFIIDTFSLFPISISMRKWLIGRMKKVCDRAHRLLNFLAFWSLFLILVEELLAFGEGSGSSFRLSVRDPIGMAIGVLAV